MRLSTIAALGAGLAVAAGAGAAFAAGFDIRSASSVLGAVIASGATGELTAKPGENPYILAQHGDNPFEVDFYDCNSAKTSCKTMVLQTFWETKKLTLEQVNGYNQWAVSCPSFLRDDGKPAIWLTQKATDDFTSADFARHMSVFYGCIQEYSDFVADPAGWLKTHKQS
jgi:hypothetical protein